jgi:hypothetical protein
MYVFDGASYEQSVSTDEPTARTDNVNYQSGFSIRLNFRTNHFQFKSEFHIQSP